VPFRLPGDAERVAADSARTLAHASAAAVAASDICSLRPGREPLQPVHFVHVSTLAFLFSPSKVMDVASQVFSSILRFTKAMSAQCGYGTGLPAMS
jgi:hypothetical protein